MKLLLASKILVANDFGVKYTHCSAGIMLITYGNQSDLGKTCNRPRYKRTLIENAHNARHMSGGHEAKDMQFVKLIC